MTRFDDTAGKPTDNPGGKWEDPISAAMFSPTDEQVESILDRTNRQPISIRTPRRKLLMAAALLAFTIMGCALGVRFLDTIWGERALQAGEATRSAASAAPAAHASQVPLGSAAPQAAPALPPSGEAPQAQGIGAEIPQPASGGAARPAYDGAGEAGTNANGAALTPQNLCADADIVAAGSFEDGMFLAEDALKGNISPRIAIEGASSLKGWAVLFLKETDGAIVFSREPYLLRMEEGQLVARDASGAPMTEFNAANAGLSLGDLRTFCAGE